MVSLTSILIAAVAATGAAAQQTNCPNGKILCGWVLAAPPYNYLQGTLESAALSKDGTFVFNSLYRCSSSGTIIWNTFCTGGGGHCENTNPENTCKA